MTRQETISMGPDRLTPEKIQEITEIELALSDGSSLSRRVYPTGGNGLLVAEALFAGNASSGASPGEWTKRCQQAGTVYRPINQADIEVAEGFITNLE